MHSCDLRNFHVAEGTNELAERFKKSLFLKGEKEVEITFPKERADKLKVTSAMLLAGWKLKKNNGCSGIYAKP